MPKKYMIELSVDERKKLNAIVSKGRVLAQKRTHAQILLKADEGPEGPALTDAIIAHAMDVSVRTVERVRQRLVEHGLDDALRRRINPHGSRVRRKLDGKGEAHLTQIACSEPPEGRERWTMRLLADRLVKLEIVDSISRETVRRTIKKTKLSRG